MSTTELSGGARIHYIFQSIFVKSLEEVDPCDDLTDDDIRTAIQNATGPKSALFVPEVPFEVLVRRQIDRLLDTSLQCARFIYDELIKMSHRCLANEMQRFPFLRKRMDEVIGNFLREGLEPSETMIGHIIEMEVIHTQAKVIADQDAMYKYILKNMLFVATVSPKATGPIGSATPEEASLVVSLVDTVTGRILHCVTHPASQAPIHAVFSENWVIYHYFNLRAHRYQMSVIEIYDESRADNKDVLKLIVGKHNLTSPISSYSRPEVLVKSQSYYFTQSVKTMAVTAIAKGITSKQILVGTIGDQVLALDKRFLDPRRTVNPTQSEKEEGIIPLTDSLPIIPQGSPSSCKLQHMTKKHIIAYGRLQGTELPEAGFYRIVLDEIVDGSVDLFDGERKLGDVILGDVLDWPIIRTILY